MAGLVFKDMSGSSVDRAYAAQKLHPSVAVYGGVVLDGAVGGINVAAVESTLRRGGRVVWMPVVDARNSIKRFLGGAVRLPVPPRRSVADGLTVLSPAGEITPMAMELLQVIAEFDAVLATGHLAPAEGIALLKAGRSAGVRRMVVNHPAAKTISASLAEQREMAELGAMLEHCAAQTTPGLDALPATKIAEAIVKVGFEHCIIASDLGQDFNPPFTDGLRAFALELHRLGLTGAQLRVMMSDNPTRLLS